MNARILALHPSGRTYRIANVFGYCTKGVPGVEVTGLDRRARIIKEKLIYLGRLYKIRMPLRRYVLCVEDYRPGDDGNGEISWLELPILLLYWRLAGHLPVGRLEDCLCGGRVSTAGIVQHLRPSEHFLRSLQRQLQARDRKLNHLAPAGTPSRERIFVIPLEEILAQSAPMAVVAAGEDIG